MKLRCAYLLVFIGIISCKTDKPLKQEKDLTWTQEDSYELNKEFVEEEEAEIEAFLLRHDDWKTTRTGTGLRYVIYKDSLSDSAKAGMTVKIKYDISLLDGTKCYTSDSTGPESFKVDKADIESGLHQGVKLMSIGDKAKFIIPSPIAHGLAGDQDMIPPLQTVVYDIELVGLK